MKKLTLLLCWIVLVIFNGSCQSSRPAPQTTASDDPPVVAVEGEVVLKIEPETSALTVGETLTVEIFVENVSALAGVDVALQFDPAVLQAQDADPAEEDIQLQPGRFLSSDFQVINTVDNGAGLAHYAAVQLAPTEPVSGEGVIAALTFEAVGTGSSALTFTQTDLASEAGQVIPVVTAPGRVAVGE